MQVNLQCRDVELDQQQGPYQLVLVEVAARQELWPHLLLESFVLHLALVLVVVQERRPFQ
jgi:hypothetical protein